MQSLGTTLVQALGEVRLDPPSSPTPAPGTLNVQPPSFYGSARKNISTWLVQVETAFSARRLSDADRLLFVPSLLGDSALMWYQNLAFAIQDGQHMPLTSWFQFVAEIKAAFQPPYQQHLLRNALRAAKQKSSVQDNVYRPSSSPWVAPVHLTVSR